MKNQKNLIKFFILKMSVCFPLLFTLATAALSQETYNFERMFPVLPQPWYFVVPSGIAVDNQGYVYIADEYAHNIQKFTTDGHFVTKWGTKGEFNFPRKIAIGKNNDLYITDSRNHRVKKYTTTGSLIKEWETSLRPTGIAVNFTGEFVYVTDTKEHHVQKFTSDGVFVKWGKEGSAGSENGEFNTPTDIAIWHSKIAMTDYIYVVDSGNYRIQKFDSDGNFISSWGDYGNEEGNFINPQSITVDNQNDLIYVTDPKNDSIQCFSPDGEFKTKLDIPDYEEIVPDTDDPAFTPAGIAANSDGSVLYLGDSSHVVQKFNVYHQDGIPEIELINKWTATGTEDGRFDRPAGIAIDKKNGNLYVADSGNDCIKQFDLNGSFQKKWGKEGKGNGEFKSPIGIAIDENRESIFVVDSGNGCIQQFDLNGNFQKKWGTDGTGDGEFRKPNDIAIDGNGNIYVSDLGNFSIKKFTPEGNFIWKILPALATSIEISRENNEDYLYAVVTTFTNKEIRKYTSDGKFLETFKSYEMKDPTAGNLFIDGNDLYFSDFSDTSVIQKFDLSKGNIPVAEIVNFGTYPGQIRYPTGLCADKEGKLYISDSGNHRIQVFKKGAPTDKKWKALIVAGKNESNSSLQEIQLNANFAYWVLLHQGLTKETIYYLSWDTELDLDDNGLADEVRGIPTKENLEKAITEWAADADELVLYLIDHGGNKEFYIGPTETLTDCELSSYLNTLQDKTSVRVMLIYEACHSGSFLPTLADKEMKSCANTFEKQIHDRERIVMTSASSDESAYLDGQGLISFSNFFWTHIFYGDTVRKSFTEAKEKIISDQHPLLNGNDNDIYDDEPDDYDAVDFSISSGIPFLVGEGPSIMKVPENEINSVFDEASVPLSIPLRIEVTDDQGVDRVWAIIQRPDYVPDPSNPISDMPLIELKREFILNNYYIGAYNEVDKPGTYQMMIYASDTAHNISKKQMTVKFESPTCKAILVAGGSPTDELWAVIEENLYLAYTVLLNSGYTKDDIYVLSPKTIEGIASAFSSSNKTTLQSVIQEWASNNTQDVLLYMIGNGKTGEFQLGDTDWLKATDLKIWLDTLQNKMSGIVTMVYDADYSGSFIPLLIPSSDEKRIVAVSTMDDKEAMLQEKISFSHFFWKEILYCASILDASSYANDMVKFYKGNRGDIYDSENGELVSDYRMNLTCDCFDKPVIGRVSPDDGYSLQKEETSVTMKIDNIKSDYHPISNVWAVINHPGYDSDVLSNLPSFEFVKSEEGAYKGSYSNFSVAGRYEIAVYARNECGNTSRPEIRSVQKFINIKPDDYEEDDDYTQARSTIIRMEGEDVFETHNFDVAGDEDWVKFYALSGKTYKIEANNLGINCDVVIELYDTDGTTLIDEKNTKYKPQADELIEWLCEKEGIYYVKFRHADSNVFGEGTEYDLRIYFQPLGGWGYVKGVVRDASTGNVIIDAIIKSKNDDETVVFGSTLSRPPDPNSNGAEGGAYTLVQEVGTGIITIEKDGYCSVTKNIVISTQGEIIPLDIALLPLGMGKISGIIKDSNGNPVANATIKADADNAVISNENGEYTIFLKSGAYSLTVEATGYCPVNKQVSVIECSETSLGEIQLVSTDGKGELSCTIKDSADNPITNATITSANCNGSVISQSDGKYTISLDAGKECIIKVGAAGYETAERKVTVKECETTSLEKDILLKPTKGDINGDGCVTLDDAIIALKVIAGLDISGFIRPDYTDSYTDVNNDNKIGLEEAVYVIQKISGL